MIALVDADIVCYRAAASCKEGDGPDIANMRADRLMQQILDRTGSDKYRAFLSGSRNFRNEIYPEYKANRRGTPTPIFLYSCKEHLIKHWNAEVSDGIEADDDMGIAWYSELGPIICSIDKDFHQLGGSYYNFVKDEVYEVSSIEATRFFYKQLLLGDKSDNIPGFDGKPRAKPTKFIEELYGWIDNMDSELDMYHLVLDAFQQDEEALHLTANLCYLWRKNPDHWVPPSE